MNQAEQATRIIAAEVRNETNARAIYDLQQQIMQIAQAARLVQIGNRLFNPAQIVLVYLSTKSAVVEFAVQDGDQPMSTTFRGDNYRKFLAWMESADV